MRTAEPERVGVKCSCAVIIPGEAAKTAGPNLQTSEARDTQPEENIITQAQFMRFSQLLENWT
jgi:hypothetical protein